MTPAVYRMYDAYGALLYIGSSRNAIKRVFDHETNCPKKWIDRVVTMKIDRFQTIEVARTFEAEAIRLERPIFNTLGVPK